MTLSRKLLSARAILRADGVTGIVEALRYQGGVQRVVDHPAARFVRPSYWRRYDNPVLGRLVELAGNRATVDGCRFTLEDPAIPTGLKALFLFDRYEREERIAVRRHLDPSQPVIELGGSIGVVACTTNQRLRDPTRHLVVEANPQLLDVLERHRVRNGCRFRVVHRALAYDQPQVRFYGNDNFLVGSTTPTARASAAHAFDVRTTTLEALLDEHGFERCTLICDIEGGEVEMVRRELEVIRRRVGTIIMETHARAAGEAPTRAMLRALGGAGFVMRSSDNATVVLTR